MSNEIKNTIAVLCKLINVLYGTSLKPEHFRLAKFDKTEENVVEVLWSSLGRILNENSRVGVQRKILSLNYNRKQFYRLHVDTNSGSRELLLALVFLIGTTIESNLQEKLEDNSLPNFLEESRELLCKTDPIDELQWKKFKESDLENFRKWLVGCISSNHDMISEYNEQIKTIQKKYNKCLDIKAHNILTIYEILALKNKTIGEKFIQETEHIVIVMSLYQDWIKKEKLFWKWMRSVLQESDKTS